ncbi:MAG: hypothetical protein AAGD22_01140 [Verrucomicrobiota bacterium]
MRVLLNVNILLACGWQHHPFHAACRNWIARYTEIAALLALDAPLKDRDLDAIRGHSDGLPAKEHINHSLTLLGLIE